MTDTLNQQNQKAANVQLRDMFNYVRPLWPEGKKYYAGEDMVVASVAPEGAETEVPAATLAATLLAQLNFPTPTGAVFVKTVKPTSGGVDLTPLKDGDEVKTFRFAASPMRLDIVSSGYNTKTRLTDLIKQANEKYQAAKSAEDANSTAKVESFFLGIIWEFCGSWSRFRW